MQTDRPERPLYTTRFEKWVLFFLVFMGVLTVTYGFLYAIDFLPEKPKQENGSLASNEEEIAAEAEIKTEELGPIDPLPQAIIFDSLGKRADILNPTSSSIDVLNSALLNGVVRHPESANFENEGTIFLFGHSSYLPNVINKNFQAFNGIQNLKWGDTVRLQSVDREYVYRVDEVYQVKATEAQIRIERERPKLTLVTCNTFGSKEDRYIVEASLVDSYRI